MLRWVEVINNWAEEIGTGHSQLVPCSMSLSNPLEVGVGITLETNPASEICVDIADLAEFSRKFAYGVLRAAWAPMRIGYQVEATGSRVCRRRHCFCPHTHIVCRKQRATGC